MPWIRMWLVDSVIQRDNDANYCIVIHFFWQFHLLFPSLEKQFAEHQPTVLLRSRPLRACRAPRDVSWSLLMIYAVKRNTPTHTWTNWKCSHIFSVCQVNSLDMKQKTCIYYVYHPQHSQTWSLSCSLHVIPAHIMVFFLCQTIVVSMKPSVNLTF